MSNAQLSRNISFAISLVVFLVLFAPVASGGGGCMGWPLIMFMAGLYLLVCIGLFLALWLLTYIALQLFHKEKHAP